MWSDTRLVDMQGVFCLCTKCIKEDETFGKECLIHKSFMIITRQLKVAAPVFACLEFEEDKNKTVVIDELYEPSKEKITSTAVMGGWHFASSWAEQKERWGIDDNLQPINREVKHESSFNSPDL
jgi:hypothetical protein